MRLPSGGRVVFHFAAIAAYAAVAIAFTWPLVLHFSTALTGNTTGDTGNYVWNQWVFQHELLDHHSLPYYTSQLFGGGRPANLSLHNYTTFQNLIAVPFVRTVGVVPTFNTVYLLMTVITAYSMFLLALDDTGSVPAAWLAGLLFAWSPFMVTRGMGHFSLVAAAPLPLLLLVLRRAATRDIWRDAVAAGVLLWWAASTDVYYAVYAILAASVFVVTHTVSLQRRPYAFSRGVRWGIDCLIAMLAALTAAIVISGGWELTILQRPVHMRTIYTPVLALTILGVVRSAGGLRLSVTTVTRENVWRVCRFTVISTGVAAVLLSPVLYALGERIVAGDFNPPEIYWRSSPRGVDLLSLIAPNPNHVLAPRWVTEWLEQGDYLENVASIPWLAVAVLVVARWRGWQPSRRDTTLLVTFLLLALGPFLYVGGINTQIPGPWALMRYLPVVGLARTPARFMAMVMLMVATLFASALTWLTRDSTRAPRLVTMLAAVVLIAELLPVPRTLYAATVPSIYARVAAAPEGTVVLHLPFGIRDGTSSIGDFSAQTEFFQTAHGKPVMGGYLSRLSLRRRRELRADPVLNALAVLSEKRSLTAPEHHAILAGAPQLIRRARVGFVVIDRSRASDDLRSVAIDAFQLSLVDVDGVFELWAPEAARD